MLDGDIKDRADDLIRASGDMHKVCPQCQHLWHIVANYCGYCGATLKEPDDAND